MHFKAKAVDSDKQYDVTLNFLKKINPDKVASKNTARCIEFCIGKAESGPYWPSLTSDKKKPHFLKADFNKWRDEDSDGDEEEEGAGDFGNMQNMFANMNAAGGAGGKPSFDDFEEGAHEDSDDEEIPNLE